MLFSPAGANIWHMHAACVLYDQVLTEPVTVVLKPFYQSNQYQRWKIFWAIFGVLQIAKCRRLCVFGANVLGPNL